MDSWLGLGSFVGYLDIFVDSQTIYSVCPPSYPFSYSLLAGLCFFLKTQFRSHDKIFYAPISQPMLDVPLVLFSEVLIKAPPEYSSPYIWITCCLFPSAEWECPGTKQSAYMAHRRQLINCLLNDELFNLSRNIQHTDKNMSSQGLTFPLPSEFIVGINIGLCIWIFVLKCRFFWLLPWLKTRPTILAALLEKILCLIKTCLNNCLDGGHFNSFPLLSTSRNQGSSKRADFLAFSLLLEVQTNFQTSTFPSK